jgi:hypothetical protein
MRALKPGLFKNEPTFFEKSPRTSGGTHIP